MDASNRKESQSLRLIDLISKQVNEETIETMIADAIRSPSGDNAQPWRFHWDGERLLILHAERLAEHSLNRKNHASMIALGALLEALRLSASKQKLSISTKLLFEEKADLSAWAEIRFFDSKNAADPLAAMILKRSTDRRAYQGGNLNHLTEEIETIEAEFEGCKIRIQQKQTSEFLNYFLKTEEILWKNSKIVKDLGKWLRLSKKEVAANSDGMSWKNIGISAVEALAFRLIRKYSTLPGLLWSFGFGLRIKQEGKKAIESSAALICFTVNSVDPETLCKVGEMAFRTWLLLNSRGFGVQPLSYASSSVGDLISGVMNAGTTSIERELFSQGKNVLQNNFTLQANEVPVWMFRTGLSAELPADTRAVKNTVDKVKLASLTQTELTQSEAPIHWSTLPWLRI